MIDLKNFINEKVEVIVVDDNNYIIDTFTDIFTNTDYEYYSTGCEVKSVNCEDTKEYKTIIIHQF